MRELNIMEVESVSGAGFFSRIGAGIIGALGVSTSLMAKGSVTGGSAGGILGVGIISGLVGMVTGCMVGALQGGLYGITKDWDATIAMVNASTEDWTGPGNPFPKV